MPMKIVHCIGIVQSDSSCSNTHATPFVPVARVNDHGCSANPGSVYKPIHYQGTPISSPAAVLRAAPVNPCGARAAVTLRSGELRIGQSGNVSTRRHN